MSTYRVYSMVNNISYVNPLLYFAFLLPAQPAKLRRFNVETTSHPDVEMTSNQCCICKSNRR